MCGTNRKIVLPKVQRTLQGLQNWQQKIKFRKATFRQQPVIGSSRNVMSVPHLIKIYDYFGKYSTCVIRNNNQTNEKSTVSSKLL